MKLIHWECLAEMDKLIEKGIKVDSIIADIPYWTTACKWDTIIPFDEMWERLNKLIKPNGAIVLFWSEPFSSALRMSNIKQYRYDWKRKKQRPSNFQMMNFQPWRIFEDILIFSQKAAVYCKGNNMFYNPQKIKLDKIVYRKNPKTELKNLWTLREWHSIKKKDHIYTHKHPVNIIEYKWIEWKVKVHPTQKPIALMEYLIKTYTNEWETVLDFTAGSGSTLVACQNTNRKGIGIELDKDYFKIMQDRLWE